MCLGAKGRIRKLKAEGRPQPRGRLFGRRARSANRSLGRHLIAKLARRNRGTAMQTAGSGSESPSTAIFATLPVATSGHPGNLG